MSATVRPVGVADNSVTSAKIVDGTILDADISSLAAIAQSKIAGLVPDLQARDRKRSYDPRDYGTWGTVDQQNTAIQAAATAWAASGGVLTLPPERITLTGRIPVPTATVTAQLPYGRFDVDARGATLVASGVFDLLADTLPTSVVTNPTSRKIRIQGGQFIGTSATGQRGIALHTTYGTVIEGCTFGSLDTGLDLRFALMPVVRSCFGYNNLSYDFRFRSLSGDVAGATGSNSGTNGAVVESCESFVAHTGLLAQFAFYECDGAVMRSCITEGNTSPVNAILFDANTNTTVKQFSVDNLHHENTTTAEAIRIANLTGGVVNLNRIFYQTAQTLINARGNGTAAGIYVSNLPYYVNGSVPFKGDLNGARWNFSGHGAGIDPRATALWADAIVPNYCDGDVSGIGSLGGTYPVQRGYVTAIIADALAYIAGGTSGVQIKGGTAPNGHILLDPNGNNIHMGLGALATTATKGFPCIPTGAGPPTGVPGFTAGLAPLYVDSTNGRIYAYVAGAWKSAALT